MKVLRAFFFFLVALVAAHRIDWKGREASVGAWGREAARDGVARLRRGARSEVLDWVVVASVESSSEVRESQDGLAALGRDRMGHRS
jgi:hypothetical protein